LVTLLGLFNTFDVIRCTFTHTRAEKKASSIEASATIVVNLPADAILSFDDQPTLSTSDIRVFVTPALEKGKDHAYTLKAEIVRNGKRQIMTRNVIVRAGEKTEVDLDDLTTAIAAR
jgi:uncharacterized protein (TIGR03000 family)